MGRKRKPWQPRLTKKKAAVFESLDEFVDDPMNSTSREVALRWRFLYELSIAAAHAGFAIESFLPDVDREGFDVVLSDHDETRPIQLKTTRRAVDATFEIDRVHCGTLRPGHDLAEQIGFESSQSGTGQDGCVVLIEVFHVDNDEPRLDVRYWITDAYILAALGHGEGLVIGAPPEAQHDASALIAALHRGSNHDRVNVRGSCFVPAASAGALLALAGFHSKVASCAWHYNLAELMRFKPDEEIARQFAPGLSPTDVRKRLDEARAEQVRSGF